MTSKHENYARDQGYVLTRLDNGGYKLFGADQDSREAFIKVLCDKDTDFSQLKSDDEEDEYQYEEEEDEDAILDRFGKLSYAKEKETLTREQKIESKIRQEKERLLRRIENQKNPTKPVYVTEDKPKRPRINLRKKREEEERKRKEEEEKKKKEKQFVPVNIKPTEWGQLEVEFDIEEPKKPVQKKPALQITNNQANNNNTQPNNTFAPKYKNNKKPKVQAPPIMTGLPFQNSISHAPKPVEKPKTTAFSALHFILNDFTPKRAPIQKNRVQKQEPRTKQQPQNNNNAQVQENNNNDGEVVPRYRHAKQEPAPVLDPTRIEAAQKVVEQKIKVKEEQKQKEIDNHNKKAEQQFQDYKPPKEEPKKSKKNKKENNPFADYIPEASEPKKQAKDQFAEYKPGEENKEKKNPFAVYKPSQSTEKPKTEEVKKPEEKPKQEQKKKDNKFATWTPPANNTEEKKPVTEEKKPVTEEKKPEETKKPAAEKKKKENKFATWTPSAAATNTTTEEAKKEEVVAEKKPEETKKTQEKKKDKFAVYVPSAAAEKKPEEAEKKQEETEKKPEEQKKSKSQKKREKQKQKKLAEQQKKAEEEQQKKQQEETKKPEEVKKPEEQPKKPEEQPKKQVEQPKKVESVKKVLPSYKVDQNLRKSLYYLFKSFDRKMTDEQILSADEYLVNNMSITDAKQSSEKVTVSSVLADYLIECFSVTQHRAGLTTKFQKKPLVVDLLIPPNTIRVQFNRTGDEEVEVTIFGSKEIEAEKAKEVFLKAISALRENFKLRTFTFAKVSNNETKASEFQDMVKDYNALSLMTNYNKESDIISFIVYTLVKCDDQMDKNFSEIKLKLEDYLTSCCLLICKCCHSAYIEGDGSLCFEYYHPGMRVPLDDGSMEKKIEDVDGQVKTQVNFACCGVCFLEDMGCQERLNDDHTKESELSSLIINDESL